MEKEPLYLKEYFEKMSSLANEDKETRHIEADELLCELLTKLGYGEVTHIYKSFKKWYA